MTLGAIGSGTTLEYIDIYASSDDGVEIFGGTVNIKYLSAAFATDDALDFDLGWRGNAQYLFTIQLSGGEIYDHIGSGMVEHQMTHRFSQPLIFIIQRLLALV